MEIRGYWEAGNCDYFVNAQLQTDDTIHLLSIDFDIDPIRVPVSEKIQTEPHDVIESIGLSLRRGV